MISFGCTTTSRSSTCAAPVEQAAACGVWSSLPVWLPLYGQSASSGMSGPLAARLVSKPVPYQEPASDWVQPDDWHSGFER